MTSVNDNFVNCLHLVPSSTDADTNGSNGVEISAGGDLLAVVSGNQASTFEANRDSIFV